MMVKKCGNSWFCLYETICSLEGIMSLGFFLCKTTRSLNVTQVNDYYPFGGVIEGTAYNDASCQAQLYKFNGNEVLEGEGIPTTLNLMNFNPKNSYEFFARRADELQNSVKHHVMHKT